MHGKLTCELILELMSMDLETYLYKSRIPKSLSDKIKILTQILEGIVFLHSEDLVLFLKGNGIIPLTSRLK